MTCLAGGTGAAAVEEALGGGGVGVLVFSDMWAMCWEVMEGRGEGSVEGVGL